MQNLDFLSLYPQVYIDSKTRATSKLGGFLSIINILIMIGISIFYFFKYFSGNEFNIKYFNENIESSFSTDELNNLFTKKFELYFKVSPIIENCEIIPILFNDYENSEESELNRCNDKLEIDSKGDFYCFNFSFKSQFYLGMSGNCTNENGKPYRIMTEIHIPNFQINHKDFYPFKYLDKSIGNGIKSNFPIITSKNSHIVEVLEYTPILYKSTKKLSRENYRYKEIYFSDILSLSNNDIDNEYIWGNKTINLIYSFLLNGKLNCDVYEREYITLLDTLSKIGGIFSPLKQFLSFLIYFYSTYENNYQIVKNLILKKNIYKNIITNNNISKIDKKIELNIETELIEKKNKINSCLHYFCVPFKCCYRNKKTIKILNLCNKFVQEHMSAENLIFNSTLFESYYEENPIRNIHNEDLKEIEKELYNYNDENELLILNDNT